MTPNRPAPDPSGDANASVRLPEGKSPYDVLKLAILHGELKPGQPLVETALASKLQVSRTPVREALNRRGQAGLVVRADRGLLVRERSPEEILDIYEARVVLEASVARVAAERRTEYDLRFLRRLLEQSAEVGDDDDDDERVRSNREFHQAMWRAGHNEAMADLLTRIDLHLLRYPATTLSYPGRWGVTLQEHAALVEAVERRDADGAGAVAHFTKACDIRLKLWDDDWDGSPRR